jgi:hypothetical protein
MEFHGGQVLSQATQRNRSIDCLAIALLFFIITSFDHTYSTPSPITLSRQMVSEESNHQSFQLADFGAAALNQNPIIKIELSTDSSTGEQSIFWEDIETFFPGLKHVHRENDIMVVHMRDRNGQR